MVLTPELIRPPNRRLPMTDALSIATRYIALWNETDPDHCKILMADLWTEAGTYRDPLMQGEGHEQIDALIAGVQGQFLDFRFTLVGHPDGYGDQVRFSWQLGPEGSEGPIKGTDFATLENGRLKSVVGFLDQVPAAA
jgi:hypothetical protein